MNYENLGLRLDASINIKEGTLTDLFGISEERGDVLDRKVKMAKQILEIEQDLPMALAYFLDECKHPNESHYCFLKLSQKCDCSLNGQLRVLSGSIEVGGNAGAADILGAVFKEIFKSRRKGFSPGDMGEPLG